MAFYGIHAQDNGKYLFTCANEAGKDSCKGQITVLLPPFWTKPFPERCIKDGRELSLLAMVDGKPTPTVEIFKDDEKIETNDYRQVYYDGNRRAYIVYIEKASHNKKRSDKGMYKAIAKNDVGVSEMSVFVDAFEPPIIVEPLVDTEAPHHGVHEIKGKVWGKPMPEVKFKREGFELRNDANYKITSDKDGNWTLAMDDVLPMMHGNYSMMARNSSGQVECSAHFTVKTAPIWLKPPEDLEVRESTRARFEFKVQACPLPEFEFAFNGTPISPGPEYSVDKNHDKKLYALNVLKAFLKDEGEYTFKAKNEIGECEGTAVLRVQHKPEIVTHVEKVRSHCVT